MRKRLIAATAAATLVLAPATSAFAQDVPADTDAVEETDGDLLGSWLRSLSDLLDRLSGAEDPGTGEEGDVVVEDPTVLQTLFDQLLTGIEIEFMVAKALEEAELEDEGDENEELEAEELESEGDGNEDDEGEELGGDEAADAENHGMLVRTVAQCAPRGQDAKGFLSGAKNHGSFVSAVARGALITLQVPNIVPADNELGLTIDGATPLDLTVTTVEDADALCAALGTIAEARALEASLEELDENDEIEALEDELEDDDEGDEKPGKAAEKAAKQDAKDAKKAAKQVAKEAKKAAKAEAKQSKAKGKSGSADASDDDEDEDDD